MKPKELKISDYKGQNHTRPGNRHMLTCSSSSLSQGRKRENTILFTKRLKNVGNDQKKIKF